MGGAGPPNFLLGSHGPLAPTPRDAYVETDTVKIAMIIVRWLNEITITGRMKTLNLLYTFLMVYLSILA